MTPFPNWKVINFNIIIPFIIGIHIDTEDVLIASHVDAGAQEGILERTSLVKNMGQTVRSSRKCLLWHIQKKAITEFNARSLITRESCR
jgi:hypothetical protein